MIELKLEYLINNKGWEFNHMHRCFNLKKAIYQAYLGKASFFNKLLND